MKGKRERDGLKSWREKKRKNVRMRKITNPGYRADPDRARTFVP